MGNAQSLLGEKGPQAGWSPWNSVRRQGNQCHERTAAGFLAERERTRLCRERGDRRNRRSIQKSELEVQRPAEEARSRVLVAAGRQIWILAVRVHGRGRSASR